MTSDESRDEEHRISVAADLETVWRLLTTAEGLASWFGTEASIELRVGGGVEVGWGSPERIIGRVDHIEAPQHLRIAYVHDGEDVGAEAWFLSHDDGVTSVRLVHSLPDPGVDDWDGYYGDYRRGWRLFLTSLRYAAELDVGPARTVASTYVPAPAGREATWAAVTAALRDEPPGPGFDEEIADPPNQLLLVAAAATVACDLEGDAEGLVCYLQVASHGPDRDGADATRWRADLLSRLTAAVPG